MSGVAQHRAPAWTADEIIVAAGVLHRHGWTDLRESHHEVHELSRLLRALPENRALADEDERFRSPGSVRRKLEDIRTAHPAYEGSRTRGGEWTRRVAEAFATSPDDMVAIAATTRRLWEESVASGDSPSASDVDLPAEAHEGRVILTHHLRRERDPRLRARKIEAVLRSHGALTCEVCEFDFGATYGDVGDGYIEVHHVVPLHATGETVTRLTDLALMCSNCLRMIHRRMPWLTPEELRARVRRVS